VSKSKKYSAMQDVKKKSYTPPKLKQYGDLRDLSKGQIAYSAEEGPYQEMNPRS